MQQRTKSKKRPYGEQAPEYKEHWYKSTSGLQNTKEAIIHQYNKTGVNRCKCNKVTTIQCTQTHTILQEVQTHSQHGAMSYI